MVLCIPVNGFTQTSYLGKSSKFGDVEYAMKVAGISSNKKKNFGALLISHELQYFRIRFQAFMKDVDSIAFHQNGYVVIPHFPRGVSNNYISGDSADGKIRYLVMEKLDMSLKDYCNQAGGRLQEHIVYSIGFQLVCHWMHFHCS